MRGIAVPAVATSLAAACVLVGTSAAPAARAPGAALQTAPPPYMNANLPIRRRVNDLLGRMTLQEKVGQMDQIVVGRLRATSDPANGECNGGNDATLRASCLRRVL